MVVPASPRRASRTWPGEQRTPTPPSIFSTKLHKALTLGPWNPLGTHPPRPCARPPPAKEMRASASGVPKER